VTKIDKECEGMFIKDGIVYASEPTESIKIEKVKVLPDYMMMITFTSGETRLFDGTKLEGKAFELLKDKSIFENVVIEHGVITWNNGEIDCAPEFMYENSYEYDCSTIL
jgi:hypothetical protein